MIDFGDEKGDTVILELRGDEIRICPALSALRRLQARLKSHVADGRLVSDELIAERRPEAKNE